MRLESRARQHGRAVGPSTWVVKLHALVPAGPHLLENVEIELEEPASFSVRLGAELLLPRSEEWWRTLEAQLAGFLAPGDQREAEVLLRVVRAVHWHPMKLRLLRRLEQRAYGIEAHGVPSEGRATPGIAPRWNTPPRRNER